MSKLENTFLPHRQAVKQERLPPDTRLHITMVCSEKGAARVAAHYAQCGLEVESQGHNVILRGTVRQFSQVFETQFHRHTLQERNCYQNSCPITVPVDLKPEIIGVLGLESLPIFGPANLRQQTASRDGATIAPAFVTQFSPRLVASVYNFPLDVDGTGQTIGIVELGGAYFQSDLNAYFAALGLGTAPTINVVSIDGAQQLDDDASFEVALDVDVIATIVPKASITVYFAENSMRGFYRAIQVAGQNNSVVSVSWGLDEAAWLSAGGYLASYRALFDSLAGTTILVASGDFGSAGLAGVGQHVSFPASVPGCLACGGTTLVCNNNNVVVSETTWSGSGGGYSAYYSKPAYQSSAVLRTMRGVPDICGNADPATGYLVRYNSATYVVGGTSAVAPLWAALVAQLNQSRASLSQPVIGNNANRLFYQMANTPAFKDITSGSNGAFHAAQGWDATTGLGVPDGMRILEALTAPVTAISTTTPVRGPYTGGTTVTVAGTGLTGVTGVKFGATSATNVLVLSDSSLTAVTGAGVVGSLVNITLHKNSTAVATKSGAFTFTDVEPTIDSISPSTGTIAGGTLVTLAGANLAFASSVVVGGRAGTIRSKNAASLTFTTPRATGASVVAATVTNSAGAASIPFTYAAMPSITLLRPSAVDIRGGTTVNIVGTFLQQISSATVDGVGVALTGKTAAQVSLIAPAHAAGNVPLVLVDDTQRQYTQTLIYVDTLPSIASATPLSGVRAGGTSVRINGANLGSIVRVLFGSARAALTARSSTSLVVRAPRQTQAGAVTVTLQTQLAGAPSPTFLYTYV